MKEMSGNTKLYILLVLFIGMLIFYSHLLPRQSLDIGLALILSTVASLTLVLKVEGATNRSHYNISFLVYGFSFITLGMSATLLVILISNLVEWVWHKYAWYIQGFNIATYFVSLQAAGFVYDLINPGHEMLGLAYVGAGLMSMVTFTLVNHLMIGIIVWLARGENFIQSGLFDFLPLMIDFTLLSMGVVTALLWTVSPLTIVLSLIPLYLIYRTLRVPALERQTEIDPKTGLFNARYFNEMLEDELARANRFDRPLTVVMGDLDLLRNINNTYGHLAGDRVLIGIADLIKKNVREYDIVARFGGEEYAILMPETTPEEAYKSIERIRAVIESAEFTVETSVTPIEATMSFGVAGRAGMESPNSFVHNADVALYNAKLNGRNRTVVHDMEDVEKLFQQSVEYRSFVPSEQFYKERIEHAPGIVPGSVSERKVEGGMPEPAEVPQLSRVQSTKDRPPWLVKIYIAILAGVGIGLYLLLSYQHPQRYDWFGLALFALIVVVTEWGSVDIYVRDTAVSTSAAPLLAGILMFGPAGALVMSTAFASVAWIKHKSRFSSFVFNLSNQLISGLLCTLVIWMTGKPILEWSILVQLVLSIIAGGVLYLSSTALISLGVDLRIGEPFQHVWRDKFSWLAPYYITMGIISYALIHGYLNSSWIGVIAIIVPLFLVRFSQEQYLRRTQVMVQELCQKNQSLVLSSNEIGRLNEELLSALADVIDLRDPYVLGHSQHVSRYAMLIAEKLNLQEEQIELVRKAGLLHDIGKLGIPESILFKPARLTTSEYKLVKEHVNLGADIIGKCHSLGAIVPIIRHHHEYFDGKGYPAGLKENDIPLASRIISVADAVEAMASDRPYRRGLHYTAILAELKRVAGTQFDPLVVNAFVEVVEASKGRAIVNSATKVQEVEPMPLPNNMVEPEMNPSPKPLTSCLNAMAE